MARPIKNNENGWIYKITSPTGRIYVGSTINILQRFNQHKNSFKLEYDYRLYNSIKKYGWEAHKAEIICECTLEEMYNLESKYGHEFEVLGKNGLNCRLPKSDEEKKCISEQTRARMSASMKGNKNGLGHKPSPESIAKRIESRKRNFKGTSPETIEKLRISHLGQMNIGYKLTQEQKDHLSKINTGKKATDEARENMRKAQFKIVFDQQTGIYYESVQEAYSCYRHSYRYTIMMLCGRKRNQTNLIYA